MDNKAFKQLDLIIFNSISIIAFTSSTREVNWGGKQQWIKKSKQSNEHQMLASLAQAINECCIWNWLKNICFFMLDNVERTQYYCIERIVNDDDRQSDWTHTQEPVVSMKSCKSSDSKTFFKDHQIVQFHQKKKDRNNNHAIIFSMEAVLSVSHWK